MFIAGIFLFSSHFFLSPFLQPLFRSSTPFSSASCDSIPLLLSHTVPLLPSPPPHHLLFIVYLLYPSSHPPLPASLPLPLSWSPFLLLGCTHACWHITLIVPAVLIHAVNDRVHPQRGHRESERAKEKQEGCTQIMYVETHIKKRGRHKR